MLCDCRILQPAGRLMWTIGSDGDEIIFAIGDEPGTLKQSGNFEATLTEIVPDPNNGQLATFVSDITITARVDNLTISCTATFADFEEVAAQVLDVTSGRFNVVEN